MRGGSSSMTIVMVNAVIGAVERDPIVSVDLLAVVIV
jgi:hypothetical protein